MNRTRQGDFIVEMSGVDVVWDTFRPGAGRTSAARKEESDRKLYCRVCGLEATVVGGRGWPTCCGESMRSATTRQPEFAVA
jgi:hypothetical protein